jgi:hypothetical protein
VPTTCFILMADYKEEEKEKKKLKGKLKHVKC